MLLLSFLVCSIYIVTADIQRAFGGLAVVLIVVYFQITRINRFLIGLKCANDITMKCESILTHWQIPGEREFFIATSDDKHVAGMVSLRM